MNFIKSTIRFNGSEIRFLENYIVIMDTANQLLKAYQKKSYAEINCCDSVENYALAESRILYCKADRLGEKKFRFEIFDPTFNSRTVVYEKQDYSVDFTWFNAKSKLVMVYLSATRERGVYDIQKKQILWKGPKFAFYYYDNDVLLIDTSAYEKKLGIRAIESTTGKPLADIDLELSLAPFPEIATAPLSRGFVYQDDNCYILNINLQGLISVNKSWTVNWFHKLHTTFHLVRDNVIYSLNSKLLTTIDVPTGKLNSEDISDVFDACDVTFTGSHFQMTEDGWILFKGTSGSPKSYINTRNLPGENIWAFHPKTKELKLIVAQSQLPEGILWGTDCVNYSDGALLLVVMQPGYKYITTVWQRVD